MGRIITEEELKAIAEADEEALSAKPTLKRKSTKRSTSDATVDSEVGEEGKGS